MPDHVENVLADRDEERRKCLAGMKTLMEDDDQLCNLKTDDRYLMRFVECGNLDVKEAYDRIKVFYDALIEMPNWFNVGYPKDKQLIVDKDTRVIPREVDREGKPIYIIKLANIDPSSMDLVTDVIAVDDFYIEYLMLSGTELNSKGVCVLIDIANFPWRLMRWLTPVNIKNCIRRIVSMPIKEYKFHVVNNSFIINAAIKIIWPFLPQHLKNAIIFHFNDMDSLYKHVDQDVLPVEYGGKKKEPYSEYRSDIYDKNSEIGDSLKKNRTVFLEVCNNNDTKVEA